MAELHNSNAPSACAHRPHALATFHASARTWKFIRDLTILGRQRDSDGQYKLLQINGSKDSSSYIINRMNLIQF